MRGSRDKARQYALKLLSYRGRSEKELGERLRKKGFSQTEAAATIHYLKDTGLVNDSALAETLRREAIDTRMLSYRGATMYLLRRGIPSEVVKQVLHIDISDELKNARRLADRKMKALKSYSHTTAKRRLYGLLSRRGYSQEIIMHVLNDKQYKEDET